MLKSSGPKLGLVLFGVLALFFVAYLLWSLIFPPIKPEVIEPVIRPQMRLAPKTNAAKADAEKEEADTKEAPPAPSSLGPAIRPARPKPPPMPPVQDAPAR
ncbi:hypothetical protein KBB96_08595 [Luteolibacter ambystomatis]|uniref:Uncharacterized protein n=1 Tax=Luteolibacter ambystomatis TaxID=2824561 RepID=A0A975J2T1_9BACT|nr:hypothetical protein [Luteolibacter ambystomatis]QUE52937.1 hypothetical protein KBB96_08595 [Luteolibacter ambystomatis]